VTSIRLCRLQLATGNWQLAIENRQAHSLYTQGWATGAIFPKRFFNLHSLRPMSVPSPVANSPIRGLERLSEDLKLERQKANAALQDRARLRIEVESLKQYIEKQSLEINEGKAALEGAEGEIESLRQQIVDAEKISEGHKASGRLSQLQVEQVKTELAERNQINDSLTRDLRESRDQFLALQNDFSALESKAESRDGLIRELELEVGQLRQKCLEAEQKVALSHETIVEQIKTSEDMDLRVKHADALKENYAQLQSEHADLRREFEILLKRNTEATTKNNECTLAINDSMKQLKHMEDQMDAMRRECDAYRSEIDTLELSREELLKRIKAEVETTQAANARADVALRGRLFLEKQIEELRLAHEESLNRESGFEEELSRAQAIISLLQNEASNLRDRAAQADSALEQAARAQAMATELECLRAQLSEIQKQLIRRDVEDEAGSIAPRAIIEREEHSRKVQLWISCI